MIDRATKILEDWSEKCSGLLAMGVPEEDVIAGLKIALAVIAKIDPELYEEIVITAKFEKLLNE